MPKVEPRTGEPPALYGMDVDMAVAELERLGLRHSLVRCDDPHGARRGADVVIAARLRGDVVELVVGSTYGWPEGAA
jgi:hypothetical protein